MRIFFILFIQVISIFSINAQKLIVNSFNIDDNMKFPNRTCTDKTKASLILIKINTKQKLEISASKGLVGNISIKDNKYYLYVNHSENQISFKLIGFPKLDYNIPINLKENLAYQLKITANNTKLIVPKSKSSELKTILIRSFPYNAAIYIDNKYMGSSPQILKLPADNYSIKLKIKNFFELQTHFDVNTTDSIYNFKLKEVYKGIVNNPEELAKIRSLLKPIIPEGQVYIYGGKFQMGSNRFNLDEQKKHEVTIDEFFIGKYEVMNWEFCEYLNKISVKKKNWEIRKLINTKASSSKIFLDKDGIYKVKKGYKLHPVVNVSYDGAQAFAKWKNAKLPTEAEWEFTARAGVSYPKERYPGSSKIQDVAWYSSNSSHSTHPVGLKNSNNLGIYDLAGNVWEWCQDNYTEDYYIVSTKKNPKGPTHGIGKCVRGGSWSNAAYRLRITMRAYEKPTKCVNTLGFRLAVASSKKNIKNLAFLQ